MLVEANSCVLMDKDQNILAAVVKDSINHFRMLFETQTHQTVNLAKIDSLQKWHCRPGHINTATIKNMSDNNVADGINLSVKNNFFCEDWQRGKMYRSFHRMVTKRSAAKCEYIHMDLCGSMTETGIGGVRYFMLLKDESTCFRYVYFLSNKSEVHEKLKRLFIRCAT